MKSIVLAELAITRGTILYGRFENIDHSKFFVIIGESEDLLVGFFFINSNIHQSIKEKPEQYKMQMHIKKSDYQFLSYDSFVCANKINIISKSKVASDIVNQTTHIKGILTDDDLNMLLIAVRSSKLFSNNEKESFFK